MTKQQHTPELLHFRTQSHKYVLGVKVLLVFISTSKVYLNFYLKIWLSVFLNQLRKQCI
jgi:hypothetical protein